MPQCMPILANAFLIVFFKTSFLISCPWSILGLLQDLVSDFDKGLDWDVVAQRGAMGKPQELFNFNDGLMAGRAEFQARDRVFFRLLPQVHRETLRLPFPTTLGCFKLG